MEITDNLELLFKSKAELAYDWLREHILSGSVAAGERISVDALVRRLGISKIPIREALKRLESQGLVVQTAHVGATVAPLNLHEIRGVFHARQAIESLVARLAAPIIARADLDRLEHTQVHMRAASLCSDLGRMSPLNAEFHLVIARASGFRVLAEFNEQLLLTVRRYRAAAPMDRDNWRRVIAEHEAILDGLARHDPEAAADAAARHAASQAEHEVKSWPIGERGAAQESSSVNMGS